MQMRLRVPVVLLAFVMAGIGLIPAGPARVQASPGVLSAPGLIAAPGPVAQQSVSQPTMLVYNTAQGLLAGDLQHAATMASVKQDLQAYPSDWPVVGVGTTNQADGTGELILDGTAGALHFWWADPSSPSQAAVSDLTLSPASGAIAFPFIALGVADPSTAMTATLDNVDNVHTWLNDQLSAAGISLAAIHLEGTFGDVMTSVSYNIPPTGVDTSGVYSNSDFFHTPAYPSGSWIMDGIYAAAPALQPVVSTAGNPVHLHGYQPGPMLGGHISSASAVNVTATIWPLDQVVVRPTPIEPEVTGLHP